MVINLYIARPTYHFILIYTCGLQLLLNEYVMLCYVFVLFSIFSLYSITFSLICVVCCIAH